MNMTKPLSAVSIDVGFDYPVLFTENVFDPANPMLARILDEGRSAPTATVPSGLRVRVMIDSGLAAAQPGLRQAVMDYGKANVPELARELPAVFPGGEAIKNNWHHVKEVISDISERRLCRHSYVIAIGGGAFLDAVGFAASLVHRGVRLIRLPSTALSQDDSGVGTKNGINAEGQKNFLGVFAPPYAVINDLALLRTLSRDVIGDGIAEAFKVAIIKDSAFFNYMAENASELTDPTGKVMKRAVQRSAELHMTHIMTSGDPFEMGDSRPLDFGHWSAHRLESMSNYEIRHGQGVAIGIALDSWYAAEKGYITTEERDRIITALDEAGLPIWHPMLLTEKEDGSLAVLDGIEQFREHLGGILSITLPKGIGEKIEVHEMDKDLVVQGIHYLQQRAAG